MKSTTEPLGFQDSKRPKEWVNVAENIWKALCELGKYIKPYIQATHCKIMTIVVEPRTSIHRMVTTMSRFLYVLRKTLHKHTKLRVQVDENDEVIYWDLICRKPYQDRLLAWIKKKVVEFWDTHSHVIPGHKHVLWQHTSKGVYLDNYKHVMEMAKVVLFKEFQASNPHVNMDIRISSKLKL